MTGTRETFLDVALAVPVPPVPVRAYADSRNAQPGDRMRLPPSRFAMPMRLTSVYLSPKP